MRPAFRQARSQAEKARVGGRVAPPGKLTSQDVARVAADAGVDARSVVRALDGRTRSPVIRLVIVTALRKFGFLREALRLEKMGIA